MNKYESVIIMKPTLTEEQKEKVTNKIKDFITRNGKIIKFESLGIKKLAYEIRKQKEGDYYVIEFNAESASIAEMQRIYRITDEIMKFIVIREQE